VITIAGSGVAGYVDGPGAQALFSNPVNIEAGPGGLMYVVDYGNDAIRGISADFTVSTWVNGIQFSPFGIAGTDSVLYIELDNDAVSATSAICRVELQTGRLTTLATGFKQARGLGLLADGTIAFSDNLEHVIRRLDPTTGTVTPIAGTLNMAGFQDGVGTGAKFNIPYDVVVLPDQSLVVADIVNLRLRHVQLDGTVTTIAGNSTNATIDGVGLAASFEGPKSLAIDDAGNIYIGDDVAEVIRRMSPDGRVVTVAGMAGTHGWRDSLDPLQAQFYHLEGIALHGRYLYVADGNSDLPQVPADRIRRVDLASLVP
jgi:streptogramin lyase